MDSFSSNNKKTLGNGQTQVKAFISDDDSYLYYGIVNLGNNAIVWKYDTAYQSSPNINMSVWWAFSRMNRYESYISINSTHVFTMGFDRNAQKLYMVTTVFGGSHQWKISRDCQPSSPCTVSGGKAVLDGSLIHTAVSMNEAQNIVM